MFDRCFVWSESQIKEKKKYLLFDRNHRMEFFLPSFYSNSIVHKNWRLEGSSESIQGPIYKIGKTNSKRGVEGNQKKSGLERRRRWWRWSCFIGCIIKLLLLIILTEWCRSSVIVWWRWRWWRCIIAATSTLVCWNVRQFIKRRAFQQFTRWKECKSQVYKVNKEKSKQ